MIENARAMRKRHCDVDSGVCKLFGFGSVWMNLITMHAATTRSSGINAIVVFHTIPLNEREFLPNHPIIYADDASRLTRSAVCFVLAYTHLSRVCQRAYGLIVPNYIHSSHTRPPKLPMTIETAARTFAKFYQNSNMAKQQQNRTHTKIRACFC